MIRLPWRFIRSDRYERLRAIERAALVAIHQWDESEDGSSGEVVEAIEQLGSLIDGRGIE